MQTRKEEEQNVNIAEQPLESNTQPPEFFVTEILERWDPIVQKDPAEIIRTGDGHGLDYVNKKELRLKTGLYITPFNAFAFALRETLGNGLIDKDDSTSVKIKIAFGQPFNTLKISDNGTKKFSREDIEKLLDFEHAASSKRGFHRATSGTHGNALKATIGLQYLTCINLVAKNTIEERVLDVLSEKTDLFRKVVDGDFTGVSDHMDMWRVLAMEFVDQKQIGEWFA